MDQLYAKLALLQVDDADMPFMRETMRKDHELHYQTFHSKREALEREYELNEKEIGDIFAQREDARKIGILDQRLDRTCVAVLRTRPIGAGSH